MKIKIGPYPKHFGTYQLAELLCFWVKKIPDECGIMTKPQWVHDFGEWLTYGNIKPDIKVGERRSLLQGDRKTTLLYKLLVWLDNDKQKVSIQIDPWDTWSMDATLSHIILPMLKQLKATTHGAPSVDDEDVPDELKKIAAPALENEWDTDENHFKRWDWVLDEMIWAFENINSGDWEMQFHTGEIDMEFEKLEDGNYEMKRGDKDTSHFDSVGHNAYDARIANGTRLLGKYYRSLWD